MSNINRLLFAGLLLLQLLSANLARAGVSCALPFNLQNGTPADATQVMANYNAIITCLGNAAAAGANGDITSLSGLTSPILPTQGGTQTYIATAPATGSANTIVVAATTPTGFVLTRGFNVVFVASATNTGPTTLQVGATATANVFRRTTDGVLNTVGGEIISGTVNIATYDGTQYQLLLTSSVPIGTILETFNINADPGFVLMLGQCLATTGIYNAVWTKVGSPAPGTCGAGNFQMPDGRGRMTAMIDSGGSNRITAAGGNFDGTQLGNSGGSQNHTMTVTELVAHNHTATDSGHTHTIPSQVTVFNQAGATTDQWTGITGAGQTTGTGFANITVGSTGSGAPFTILSPVVMVNRQVKY